MVRYWNQTDGFTECDLRFSFDKLISFEAKFEEEFDNEPSLDEYVNEYVNTFRMRKDQDEFVFPEYISCSGINLLVNKLMGTSIQLYDKEKSTVAYEIKENKDKPLGYSKWTVSRFKLLANDYIDEDIMFDTMRIYDLSDDGNYITLIDYYDNYLKVKISPDSKSEKLINRILYLHEQRQIYHAINCFADFYGYIGMDENDTPVFFIEMID
ncbi:hypothetical protein SAMN04487775_107120 [Treponema bryantii]|uniref:Uncharacterized protein n=1 Tax=Treponema bryantii TaxID=163 RepID=A0A1I3LPQ5_9SPIR|nr:hypothetical protein [Treponema bryantii]SFI86672.1 hypothetical protein SAMN04487775_107120 [Treponema bryantii]